MEKNGIVRLEALRMKRFKNVINGEIYFAEKKKVERGEIDEDDFSNILGLYGQNGSGKTTSLNVLRFIQLLFSGMNIPNFYSDYISNGYNDFSVGADFLIRYNEFCYYVVYDITIGKKNIKNPLGAGMNAIEIKEEKLSYYKINGQKKKTNIYSFAENKVMKSFLEKLESKDSSIYSYTTEFESNTLINPNGMFSTIFNPKLVGIVMKNKEQFADYSKILNDLRLFAITKMAIYTISYFNENEKFGIRFRVKEETFENGMIGTCGDMFIPFSINNLTKENYLLFKKNIDRINKVLPSIIPSYKVEIIDAYKIQNLSNQDVVSFTLMSNKNGVKVPLIYESNGIKKIISILSGFIDAYNHEGCLMAIDELDSGIFEYLLGEIVYAFENFGNGQLLFTSHNMRVLEKLNYKNIMFTTTNDDNKFIQLSSIKENNNLRDLYYRYITNGYKDNLKLYDMVKTEELIAKLIIEED